MATVQILAYEGQTLTIYFSPRSGASGSPSGSGYLMDEHPVHGGLYEANVTGLLGEFYIYARNAEGELAFAGYVDIATEAGTYRHYDYQVYADAQTIQDLTDAVNAVKAKTDLIGVSGASNIARSEASNITTFVGETHSITLPTDDFSSNNLVVAWETTDKTEDVAKVLNADISKTTTSIEFSIPAEVTATARNLLYSIRDEVNGNRVLAHGFWRVLNTANPDA